MWDAGGPADIGGDHASHLADAPGDQPLWQPAQGYGAEAPAVVTAPGSAPQATAGSAAVTPWAVVLLVVGAVLLFSVSFFAGYLWGWV
ncbi:hypothetical protein [Propionibacterium freudenreichii]|uniref:hypothetical protein n=1 Tax=Propionibacterium freudenreichii TaxID=1744 RepID=UPI00385517ED